MTAPSLLREWATDPTFTSGPSNGQPTKVDPGAAGALQGFVPGLPVAASHVNHLLNALSRGVRRQVAAQTCKLVWTDGGLTSEDAMAAISLGPASGVLAIKSGASNVKLHSDSGRLTKGSVASITSLVTGAARNGARIVAIGTGGNNSCFSINNGGTWTAGGAIGGTCNAVIYNPVFSRFQATRAIGANAHFSTDGTSWSTGSTWLDNVFGGIALLSNGNTVACGQDNADGNDPAFSRSTNGGTSWADTGGTVDNPDTYGDSGWVCGDGGTTIWHVGRRNSGSVLTISSSLNGTTWTALAELTGAAIQSGTTYPARPRILRCPGTGLLFIVAPINGQAVMALYASLDNGVTWTEPMTGISPEVDAYSVAGGRLWLTSGTEVFSSVGIGGT